MPNPTLSDIHVNRPLTNVMTDWNQNNRYAYKSVFPMVDVPNKSDEYFIWDRADFFRDEAKEMAPGDAAPVTVARLSTDSYNCKVYGLAERIPDQHRSNADAPLQLERSAVKRISQKLNLRAEKHWAANFFTTGVWTGSTTGTDLVGVTDFVKYASPSTGTPVVDIREQITHLEKLGVNRANMKLTVGPELFAVFLDHDDFLTRYEQVQASILNEQLMAAVLGIGELIVPNIAENTAAEGAAATQAYIMGDSMLLSWAPSAPSINEPSAGYTYNWSGLVGSQEGGRILRMRDDIHHSDHIEGQIACDPKVTAAELGVFFSDCL